MLRVILTRGLPASGKTTWAKELLKKEPGRWKRINKDDIRAMLDDSRWSKENEAFVLTVRDWLILEALKLGKNVVVDDTNLSPKHFDRITELTKGLATVEYQVFDTDLATCITRDLKRPNSVGEKVIKNMWDQFFRTRHPAPGFDPNLPMAIICDIDGTLAKICDRSPYDYPRAIGDSVNEPVRDVLRRYADDVAIVLMSGRELSCWGVTREWLKMHKIPYNHLHMRRTGDNRKDSVVKEELYREYVEGIYNVLFVLDDRNQVVDLWRDLGLTCFQVAEGDF